MSKLIKSVLILLVLVAGVYAGADEILIGYFGPSDASHPTGGQMWSAANMAIAQANQNGGYKGSHFRLVPGWSDNPWGSGVSEVVKMAYTHNVRAIIGGIDGSSTHLAEQVVAKAHLPLISGGCMDKTANFANVPWLFTLPPVDKTQAAAIADAVKNLSDSFTIVSSTDHDNHLFAIEIKKKLNDRKLTPVFHFEFEPNTKNISSLTENILNSKASDLILIAGTDDSARLLKAVRKKGFAGKVFGSPAMGRNDFIKNAEEFAEGVIFPLLYLASKHTEKFDKDFKKQFGSKPDYLAAHNYDAVNMTIAAIRAVGLDREKIRDAIKTSSYKGVTGDFFFSKFGENLRSVSLGTITDRAIAVYPEPWRRERSPADSPQ